MKKLLIGLTLLASMQSFASNNDNCLKSIEKAIVSNEAHIHKNRVATYDAVDFDQVALRAEASKSRKDLNILERIAVTPAILFANVDGYFQRKTGTNALEYLNFIKNVEEGKASESDVRDILGRKVNARDFLDIYSEESVCKTQMELSKELSDSKPSNDPSSLASFGTSEEVGKAYRSFIKGKSDIVGKKLYINFFYDAQVCYGDYYSNSLRKNCDLDDKNVSIWLIKTKKELLKL
jgi:hypothetical protein